MAPVATASANAMRQIGQSVSQAASAAAKGGAAHQQMAAALQNMSTQASSGRAQLANLQQGMAALGSAGVAGARAAANAIQSGINRAVGVAQASIGRLNRSLRGIGGAAGGAAAGLGTLAAIGGAIFGIGAIRNAVSFEKQLATINTIANVSTSELRDMGTTLQKIAIEGARSIDDITAAMYEFQSAGIGRSESFTIETAPGQFKQTTEAITQTTEALRAATNLSIGALASEEEAVRFLSFALNAFGLNQATLTDDLAKQAGVFQILDDNTTNFANSMGEAATVIADQFAKAVEIGVVTASEIGGSFQNVAAAANAAGIGLDEIAAAYATQTVRGVTAARVTTSMQRAIQDLIQPGKQLRALMEATGKSYADIARTEGVHVALQEMRNDANRLGIEYRDLFKRQEGWRFALNITADDVNKAGNNYQLYLRVLDQINRSTGTAEEQAAKLSDTVSLNADRVRIAFGVLQAVVGTPFLQPLNDLLKSIIAIEIRMIDWARANEEVVKEFAPIVGLVAGLVSLTAGTQGLLAVLTRVAPAVGFTATGFSGLARAISVLALPLGLIVGAFGTFQYLVTNGIRGFEGFRHELLSMQRVGTGIAEVFRTLGEGMQWVWHVISIGGDATKALRFSMDRVGQAVENVGPAFENMLEFLGRVALAIGTLVVEALQVVVPAIIGWAAGVAETLAPHLLRLSQMLVAWVGWAAPKLIAALGRFVGEVGQNISRAAPVILEALASWTEMFVGWAARVIPRVIDALGEMARRVAQWIGEVAPVVVGALATWATGFATWFATEAFPAIVNGISRFIGEVTDWISSSQVIRRIAEAVTTWAAGVILGIGYFIAEAGPEILRAIAEIGSQIVLGIGDFLVNNGPQLVAAAIYLAGRFLAGLAEAIIADPTIIAKALMAMLLASAVFAAVGKASNLLANRFILGFIISEQIGSIVGRAWQAINPALSFIAGKVAGAAYTLGVKAATALVRVLQAAWQFVQPIFSFVAGTVAGAAYNAGIKTATVLGPIIRTAWTLVAAVGVMLATVAGMAAGAAYNAAVRLATLAGNAMRQLMTSLWGQATGGSRLAAAAGAFAGKAYTMAMKAAMAIGQVIQQVLSQGGLTRLAGVFSGAGTAGGLAFGRAFSLVAGAAVLIGVAEIAKNVSGPLNQVGRDIHKALFPNGGILTDIGAAWTNWRQNTPWPLGQKDAPEWAGGKPIPGPVILPPTVAPSGPSGLGDLLKGGLAAGKDILGDLGPKIKAGLDNGMFIMEDGVLRMREWWDAQPPIDMGKFLEDGPKSVEQVKQDMATEFDELITSLQTDNAALQTTLNQIQEGGYTSTEQQLASLRQFRRQIAAEIDKAREAGDEAAESKLLTLYNQTSDQIVVLSNAGTIVKEQADRMAAEAQKPASVSFKEFNDRITLAIANAKELRKLTQLGEIGQFGDRTNPTPTVITPPKIKAPAPITPAEEAYIKAPFQRIATDSKRELDKIPPAASKAMTGVTDAITRKKPATTAAARQTALSVKLAFIGLNLFSQGRNLIQTFINGLLSKKASAYTAAQQVAWATGAPFRGKSPPEVGPLRSIARDGANIVTTIADAMLGAAGYARQAAMEVAGQISGGLNAVPQPTLALATSAAMASPTSVLGGPRQIMPMVPSGGAGGAMGLTDRIMLERQTELLGQIAASSTIGAEASSRIASHDPIAGGALPARGTLSALKHLQHGRNN